MKQTIDLLTDTLTELAKRKAQYEALLTDTNNKIQSHESVFKLIEDESNNLRRLTIA